MGAKVGAGVGITVGDVVGICWVRSWYCWHHGRRGVNKHSDMSPMNASPPCPAPV